MNRAANQRVTASITGTGSYLPEKVVTNVDLEKVVDTTDEWIRQRTGIRERHMARSDEATSDMAAVAAERALENAKVQPSEVDLIIVATITPDMVFPNTACFVQSKIGAKNAFCFGVEAACSGFLYALEIARQFIGNGSIKTALVIGAEKLSTVTDWEDRTTCVLFGDGAGAVVVQAGGHGKGLMDTVMGSDGTLTDLLKIPGGGSRYPASKETIEQRLHYMKMEGREVFKHAVRCMCDAGQKVLERCGLSVNDVACVIPHQANMRIIQAIAERLGAPLEKFHNNLERVGNMSAASVPVALDEAARLGKLKKGDIVLFIVFGGGFTWGAMVLEWEKQQ
jgi:3-oxoacyl-[acyl-carrier-protein] synthase-3